MEDLQAEQELDSDQDEKLADQINDDNEDNQEDPYMMDDEDIDEMKDILEKKRI